MVFLSCPTPFDRAVLLQVKDEIVPIITIHSPADGSAYSATIEVQGVVKDTSSGQGDAGKIRSLHYEVLATTLGAEVPCNSDGSFSFRIPTENLSGPLVIQLSAEDWNSNIFRTSLTLIDAGNDIPSFSAQPGNHQVTLTWDPVPLATSYTLHYTTHSALPTEFYGLHVEHVTSPLVVDSLANGSMHVFLLQAHSSEGPDNWSGYQRAIPLSPFTLGPVVTGEYRKLVVEWPDIPGTDEYELLRSTSRDGQYINTAGTLHTNRYEDTVVSDNQLYFYKVRPALEGSLESCSDWGTSSTFPPGWIIYTGYVAEYFLRYCDIAIKDQYIYVTTGLSFFFSSVSGLKVFDITNPSSPLEVGSVDLDDTTSAPGSEVVIDGNYAYVAGPSGLYIVDIQNPALPEVVGSCEIPGEIEGLDVEGDYAYVAAGDSGVSVVTISNTSNPSIEVTHEPPVDLYDHAYDVAYHDGALYVAAGADGVCKIDPISGTVLNTADTAGIARSLVINAVSAYSTYIYVADDSAGVTTISLSGGAPFSVVDTRDTAGNAVDLNIIEGSLIVSDGSGGVLIFGISVPSKPKLFGYTHTPVNAQSAVTRGEDIFVADLDAIGQLKTFHLSSQRPQLVQIESMPWGETRAIAMDDSFIFTDDSQGNLVIIDRSTQSPAATYQNHNSIDDLVQIIVKGDYAFLTYTDMLSFAASSIEIVDISNINEPKYLSSLDYNTGVLCRAVWGDYAYLVGIPGLQIVDISNPSSPQTVNTIIMAGTPTDLALRGRYAYVSAYTGGLQIVDVSDPEQAAIVGFCKAKGAAMAIAVRDRYAYLGIDGEPDDGLQVIDVSSPNSPQPRGFCRTTYYPNWIVNHGNYAYFMESDNLEVADILDPAIPSLVSSVSCGKGDANELWIEGDLLYVNVEGIRVFDLLPEN